MPEMSVLAQRRDELDLNLSDVGEAMSQTEAFGLAASTLSERLSEWERGERDPDDEDLEALDSVYDEIEAEQNYEHPECVVCERIPKFEPVPTPEGPTCIACDYGSDGEEGY